jgi:hypothetical protein
MDAYSDWWLERARCLEGELRSAASLLLARARGEEPRPAEPIIGLDDTELRELTDFLREACGHARSMPLLIQLREAAWELQRELNRREDLRYRLTLEARRAARRAGGSSA